MLSSEKSSDIFNLQLDNLNLSQADKLHVLHPWTDLSALGEGCPLIMKSASGIRVSDSQGRTYLDAIGGMWCMTLGYGRTELAVAMSEQAQTMAYYTPFGDIETNQQRAWRRCLQKLHPAIWIASILLRAARLLLILLYVSLTTTSLRKAASQRDGCCRGIMPITAALFSLHH